MKLGQGRHNIICFTLFVFSFSVVAEPLRVRFLNGQKKIRLSGYNIRFNGAVKPSSFNLNRYEVVQTLVKHKQVWRVYNTETRAVEEFRLRKLRVDGDFIRMNWKQVANKFDLIPESYKRISVVAYMDMEKYLEVVLPSEMPPRWPIEAVKAQAIASRTYAYLKRKQRRRFDYDVESSVNDQVFNPDKSLRLNSTERKKVLQSLKETRGKMLVDKAGRVFPAYYHSDCGGETEEPKNVWGGHRRMGTVKDHQCPAGPHSNWNFALNFKKIEEKLSSFLKAKKMNSKLTGLQILKRSSSGRVLKVKLLFTKQKSLLLSGQDLRELLGYGVLKSTKFQVMKTVHGLRFVGNGFGHGAGMCQWGGKKLASKGWSHKKILKRYYPQSKLRKIL